MACEGCARRKAALQAAGRRLYWQGLVWQARLKAVLAERRAGVQQLPARPAHHPALRSVPRQSDRPGS